MHARLARVLGGRIAAPPEPLLVHCRTRVHTAYHSPHRRARHDRGGGPGQGPAPRARRSHRPAPGGQHLHRRVRRAPRGVPPLLPGRAALGRRSAVLVLKLRTDERLISLLQFHLVLAKLKQLFFFNLKLILEFILFTFSKKTDLVVTSLAIYLLKDLAQILYSKDFNPFIVHA